MSPDANNVAAGMTREEIMKGMNPQGIISKQSMMFRAGMADHMWGWFVKDMVSKGYAKRLSDDSLQIIPKKKSAQKVYRHLNIDGQMVCG